MICVFQCAVDTCPARLNGAEWQEAEERGPNGEKMPVHWEGGRPVLGLLSQKRRHIGRRRYCAAGQGIERMAG